MPGIVNCIIYQNNKTVVEGKREDLDTKSSRSILVLTYSLYCPQRRHLTQLSHPLHGSEGLNIILRRCLASHVHCCSTHKIKETEASVS